MSRHVPSLPPPAAREPHAADAATLTVAASAAARERARVLELIDAATEGAATDLAAALTALRARVETPWEATR